MASEKFIIQNVKFKIAVKNFYILLLISSLFFTIPQFVYAQSNYVLPYPSAMPGSKFYQVQVFIQDHLMQYWYFGDLGQFTYQLKQSDKYLVEAKTLFEYKQYLLAYNALKKSDAYFQKTPGFLEAAKKTGKDVDADYTLFNDAASKHKELLIHLIDEVPEEFVWSPEKSAPTVLLLKETIEQSIRIREGR